MDDEYLLCAVCKKYVDETKDPRNLDCGHSYCFSCLQQQYHDCVDKIACMECQAETSLPNDGLTAVRCNPILVGHMKKRAQSNSTSDAATCQNQAEFQGLLTKMKSSGIAILSQGAVLSEFIYEVKATFLYALFYRQNGNEAEFQHAVSLFIKLAKLLTSHESKVNANIRSEAIVRFVAIDMDKCSVESLEKCINENDTVLWRSGICTLINKENMENLQDVDNLAFIRYNLTFTPIYLERSPLVRAKINMGCPKEGCEYQKTKWNWHCCACIAVLEYDFDHDNIFCDCGAWKNSAIPESPMTYEASCGNASHPFTTVEHAQLRNLLKNLQKTKDLNILVLGETGVGKSTWINAMANYAASSTLKDAEAERNFRCLIKSDFARQSWDIFGKIMPKTKVSVTNEAAEAEDISSLGESDTNIPSSYLISTRKYNVRIIDTPGIGDTRGKDKDIEHCEHILHFLANSQFKEIHGICILLKSGTTRLSESYKYCLTELLKQFHKSAAKNIIFAFTYARISHFKNDQTLYILKKMLLDIEGAVKVSLSAEVDKNVFLLDNETFKYLCLVRNKKKFDPDQVNDFEKSWNHSKAETDRLFKYANSLTPYDINNSSSIFVARNLIARIINPALMLHQMLGDNNISMEKALKVYESCPVTCDDKIYVHMKRKLNEPLATRSILCKRCTDIKIINSESEDGKKHKEEVHAVCRVCQDDVPFWLGFYIALSCLFFKAMRDDYDNICPICRCTPRSHVLSSYSQTTVTYYDSVESIQKLKDNLDETKRSLSKTAQIMAKFSFFLQSSALAKYRDGILDQIEVELNIVKNREVSKTYSEEDKAQDIEILRIIQSTHENEMKKFLSGTLIEPNQICALRDELYGIPSIGKELKRLMDIEEKARTREIFPTETLSSRIQRMAIRMFDVSHSMWPFSRSEPKKNV